MTFSKIPQDISSSYYIISIHIKIRLVLAFCDSKIFAFKDLTGFSLGII